MARRKTKADLEIIIAGLRADIAAHEQRNRDWVDRCEEMRGAYNTAINK